MTPDSPEVKEALKYAEEDGCCEDGITPFAVLARALRAAQVKLAGQESEILSLRSALNVFEDEVKSIAGSVNGSWLEVVTGMQERIRHLEALVALPCPKDHEAKLSDLSEENKLVSEQRDRMVERLEKAEAAEAKLAAALRFFYAFSCANVINNSVRNSPGWRLHESILRK